MMPLRGRRSCSEGYALLGVFLLLMMASAMALTLAYMSTTETRLGGTDLENTLAYYGAEAAMEQMITDLSGLYGTTQVPTQANIDALESKKPAFADIEYPQYDLGTLGATELRTLSAGPNQGLIAMVTPLPLNVTARRTSGAEVRLSRDIEVAQIPIFQFARFSEFDLQVAPGPAMDIYGRVHTNGHLFVSSATGPLTFHARVTTVREVVRDNTQAGDPVQPGKVYFSTATTGCQNLTTNCRELKPGEGSVLGWVTGPDNPNWPTISTGSPPGGYNGNLLNGDTGARRLELPLMQEGSNVGAIEIIRRPRQGEDAASLVGQSRLYNIAQIRVLLSNSAADLPGGAADAENVQLANTGPYSSGIPVAGANPTYFAEAKDTVESDWIRPPGLPENWPLLDGYLRVETRRADGTYVGVTRQWLGLGFARGLEAPDSELGRSNTVHPNAILVFQLLADRDADGDVDELGAGDIVTGAGNRNNWYPINLYDSREGEVEQGAGNPPNLNTCAIGASYNAVELDVGNLRKWLLGTIPGTGSQVEDSSQNGFVLYFSDRRGMLPNPNLSPPAIIGEYGYEDVLNPNGVLDLGEDSNGNGVLDVWGKANLGDGFIPAAQGGNTASDDPATRVPCLTTARKNRVTGARHGLKLVNGSLGNLPTKRAGGGGFTVTSENPTYVVGNYNAKNNSHLNWTEPHAAAALITDRVTLLSKSWKDLNSLKYPTDVWNRNATDAWWRTALLSGVQIGNAGVLLNLENWTGRTWHYNGSEVSLYNAEYSTGLAGCCQPAYRPPTRNMTFDTDFLSMSTMPPGTPMLRDVVNLGFRQVFRAD